MSSVYDFTVDDIAGQPVKLDRYKGKVLLVVNTASKCGFTPQYKGLEALYRKYQRHRASKCSAFPATSSARRSRATSRKSRRSARRNYDVTFPMFAKVDVNGEHAAPLYRYLKSAKPGLLGTEAIKWNFTKFLVDRTGNVVARYAPNDTPESLEGRRREGAVMLQLPAKAGR